MEKHLGGRSRKEGSCALEALLASPLSVKVDFFIAFTDSFAATDVKVEIE